MDKKGQTWTNHQASTASTASTYHFFRHQLPPGCSASSPSNPVRSANIRSFFESKWNFEGSPWCWGIGLLPASPHKSLRSTSKVWISLSARTKWGKRIWCWWTPHLGCSELVAPVSERKIEGYGCSWTRRITSAKIHLVLSYSITKRMHPSVSWMIRTMQRFWVSKCSGMNVMQTNKW